MRGRGFLWIRGPGKRTTLNNLNSLHDIFSGVLSRVQGGINRAQVGGALADRGGHGVVVPDSAVWKNPNKISLRGTDTKEPLGYSYHKKNHGRGMAAQEYTMVGGGCRLVEN